MEKNFDITPYFFSHNGNNSEEFKDLLLKSFDDFVNWRNSFHKEDTLLPDGFDKNSEGYKEGIERLNVVYQEMLNRLHGSIPFHSPRYLGHMQSERFMPSVIGYFASLLYNLNNVSFEGSPVTVEMEYEVAKDLAKMVGFDTETSWGHLTGGGTVANIEALWVVRNTKYFPLIAQDVAKGFHKDFDVIQANGTVRKLSQMSEYEMLSLPPNSINMLAANFLREDWGRNIYQDIFVNKKNISHVGMENFYNGKILVSATKHYSWPKAAEILGFGRQNVVQVAVDENMRMDIDDLRNKLVHCVENREPIVSVIAIAGATESSAVDYIDKIKDTRDWLEKEYNSSFFIHIDAAYGGYIKSLFLDNDNNIKSYEKVKEYMGGNWPSKELYNAFCAFDCADSITIDPHKLGYLPYPAGAILYKNKITKSSTVSHAPYISSSTKPADEDLYFGEYVLEGSKSGAAAAACWLAHRIVPLNDFGYGKFLKNEIIDAQYIINLFKQEFPKNICGKSVDVRIFNDVDIDVLLYAFNFEGNDDIDVFNDFNERILKKMCFVPHENLDNNRYMVVSTTLEYKTYKNSINNNLKSLGLDIEKWTHRKSCVHLFRTVVMNINLYTDELKEYYYRGFVNEFVNSISEVLKEMNIAK